MKKQLLLTAGVLACTAAMAHIVVDVHYTQYDFPYVSTFYLDDISSIELFSNYDGWDDRYQGQSGIRINGNDYFSSEIDSVVWHDYIDPGLGDFSSTLATADEVQAQMNQLYRSMNAYSDMQNSNWGWINHFVGSHPTLDTQGTGWDADFNNQRYDMNNADLNDLWSACYRGVFRCNMTIQALESTTAVDAETANVLIAEARTIRGFFYIQLASTFGRVPLFTTGEDHASAGTNRVCAGSYAEMWDYIIEDFCLASEVLDWTPRQTARSLGNNGTMNKGIALTYLGDAYMWKAYRCPELASECYKRAADALGQVINDGPYRLNDSFTTLWDAIPRGADYLFNPEAIYVQILEDTSTWSEDVPSLFAKFYAAPPSNGGWGALFLSWEWYSSYEKGDKRRDASCVTSYVPLEQMAAFGLDCSQVTYGMNPYLKEPIGGEFQSSLDRHFKYGTGEIAPAIWSMKLWRNASANSMFGWTSSFFCATNIYWKRLPNVMLDYAECLFNLGDESKAWEIINQLRNRAFGNLEVGKEQEIADKYLPEINRIFAADGYGFQHDSYPMPLNQETVEVPDAETYYTGLKEQKHFDSPVWKVAVNEERRKEFNSEWCLRPDMERSGYLEDHIEHNYPRAYNNNIDLDYPWTDRTFIFDRNKLLFPIPIMELRRNSDCLQNPGY